MPHSKSAAKRLKQSVRRQARNRSATRALRTQIRKVRDAVEAKDLAKAESEFHVAESTLDQAGARRIIHPNAASRTKSRLSAAVKGLKQAAKV
jgi:small subunit ribosomal protein S20